MKNKIIYISIFLVAVLINVYNFTDVFGETAIPKVKLYGTSTYWADSTNYQTTNKSVYVHDSLKIGKDLYVGVKGGKVYLDTNRKAVIEYSGNTFKFTNNKNSGGFSFENSSTTMDAGFSFILGEGVPAFTIYKYRNGQLTTALVYDTLNGLNVQKGNIFLSGGTQEIKLVSDSASDYDANDAITLNRQSGNITTKALTTATSSYYDLVLVNSLISTSSKVFVSVIYTGGTNTSAPCFVTHTVNSAGSTTIGILNFSGSNLNSVLRD